MANSERLDKIKRRLGIDQEDAQEIELLRDLIEDAEAYFKGLTGALEVAEQYDYIIRNVVVKMYARKGSEAVRSETVDGYSVTYEDWSDMFKPYEKILTKDFNDDSTLRERGKVRFL